MMLTHSKATHFSKSGNDSSDSIKSYFDVLIFKSPGLVKPDTKKFVLPSSLLDFQH